MTELPTPAPISTEGVVRRRFLAWSSTAILGALAFSGKLPGFSIEQAFAQTPGGGAMARPSISAKATSAF